MCWWAMEPDNRIGPMIECNRRAYAGSVCETNNCRAHMNSVRAVVPNAGVSES